MLKLVPYDDAVDLLDADHKAVKKMFMDYNALCDARARAPLRQALAQQIGKALRVHAQIEEELFYPEVRDAIGDDALMDAALQEHAKAKEMIALIESMDAGATGYDATVQQLGMLIDAHVLAEREQMFLRARQSALDLSGMAGPLYDRKRRLTGGAVRLKVQA